MWFEPKRPRLAEATAIARESSSDAWQRMIDAGLVAPSADRRFVGYDDGLPCANCSGTGLAFDHGDQDECHPCGGWGSFPRVQRRSVPIKVDDCIAFAADGDALAEVERRAREVASGVDVWRRAKVDRERNMVWVTTHWHRKRFPTRPLLEAHGDVAVLFDNALRISALGPEHYPKIPEAIRKAEALFAERVGDREILAEQRNNRGIGEAAFQVVYTWALYELLAPSLPDVFATLFRIFELGYAVQGVTDDRIELIAPPSIQAR